MDCRAFRKRHLAFVDDTLPGVDVLRMQIHLGDCAECAAWDHRVRRSLLLVRNHLNPIEPSADFSVRLAARLELERHTVGQPALVTSGGRWRRVAVVALALAVAGASSLAWSRMSDASNRARLPTIVLHADARGLGTPRALPDATPGFMASVSTGMAILPALMLAEEVPVVHANGDGTGVMVRTAGTVNAGSR